MSCGRSSRSGRIQLRGGCWCCCCLWDWGVAVADEAKSGAIARLGVAAYARAVVVFAFGGDFAKSSQAIPSVEFHFALFAAIVDGDAGPELNLHTRVVVVVHFERGDLVGYCGVFLTVKAGAVLFEVAGSVCERESDLAWELANY